MWRFLIGMGLGALGAYYLKNRPEPRQLEERMREWQARSGAVVDETRRIFEETRGELGQALEAGKGSVQQKADRLKTAATGQTGGMGTSSPTI